MTERTRIGLLAILVTMVHGAVVWVVLDAPEGTSPPPSPPVTWIGLSAPVPQDTPPSPPIPVPPREPPFVEGAAPVVPGSTEAAPPPAAAGPSAVSGPDPAEPPPEAPTDLAQTPPRVSTQDVLARLVYPPLALRRRLEATVVLELAIDEAGMVTPSVVEDPGHGFAEAAVRALQGLVATPAWVDGKPVASRLRYPVRFVLP